MRQWLETYIKRHSEVIVALDLNSITRLIDEIKQIRDSGRQIFIIGNGGSAAIGSHLAVDLGKGASIDRKKRFRVISFADNTAWLTALGNDIGFEDVFVEQIINFAQKGDLLLAISVSGSSPNILKAVQKAKDLGLNTAALIGDRNGKLIDMVDLAIVVPSKDYAYVEDAHATICHMISYYFMEED